MMIQATSVNPHYYYPATDQDMADKFFAAYRLELEGNCAVIPIPPLKDRKARVCRFCGKKSPYVSFYNTAHVVPEFFGNKRYISDAECDDCNKQFSRYEDSLANYLGIVRTIQSVQGKKVPKFKSAGKNMHAESTKEDDTTNVIEIRRYDGLDSTFEFDKENRMNVIHYTKASYIPLHVYKGLLKIALSVMPGAQLNDYTFAMEYIRSNKRDDHFSGFAILTRYIMPLTFIFESPTFILFKKKDPNAKTFTHVFLLYALNCIFQIYVPFNTKDRQLFQPNSGPIDALWCPPLLGRSNLAEIGPIQSLSFDLNSSEKVSGEKESLRIPALNQDFETIDMIDKNTGEIRTEIFDANKIIGINLMMKPVDDPPNKA